MDEAVTDGELCDCKVGRVLARRNRRDLDVQLRERWRDGEESLRDLERRFNLAVLRSAAREAGMTPLDGELENVYRLLTDDEVTSGARMEVKNRLRRESVDVEAVIEDFVSHQTVHSHLTECHGVEREDDSDPVDAARDRVRSLRNRMEAVTGDAVGRLATAGEYDAYVDVSVVCEECGRRHDFDDFVESGACDCRSPD